MNDAPPPRRFLLSPKLWALVAVIACAGAFLATRPKTDTSYKYTSSTPPITVVATSGPFLQEVIERGEVGSSSNVEIRCQVQSKALTGTPIIEIVPEGTYVKEGDFLVKLDDSALQADMVQQQIACNSSRALEVEALADFEGAKLALEEYQSGTFLQDSGLVESEKFVAQENMRRAEEYLRYSLKLAERGYVTEVQLEADRFAVEKARKELDNSSTKLEVLHKFTKVKTINRLKAAVETAEARWRSRQNSHNLDEERLQTLQDQLSKCSLTAPTSGQVVYANLPTGDPLIAEGKPVRERQVIIRLPDPKRMQVLARINESRIDKVKVGMPSRIRMDAFPNLVLTGTVKAVSEYPLPAASVYSTIKEYGAEITIDEAPAGARSGMTAQVAIEVQHLDSALQVPVQTVLERGKRFFCIVENDGELIPKEVRVGAANDQSVIISEGLEPGEQVILAPQNYESKVTLPDVASKAEPTKAPGRKLPQLADNSH